MVYLCAAKNDLNVDAIGYLDPHELPKGALISIQIDESLVDTHLPAVPGLAPLSVRTLPAGDPELLRRKRYRAADVYASSLGYPFDLCADTVDLCRVCSAERDSCTL